MNDMDKKELEKLISGFRIFCEKKSDNHFNWLPKIFYDNRYLFKGILWYHRNKGWYIISLWSEMLNSLEQKIKDGNFNLNQIINEICYIIP